MKLYRLTWGMFVGGGSYGKVYRVSENLCVKVFSNAWDYNWRVGPITRTFNEDKFYEAADSEINGSFEIDAVPVLDIVNVIMPEGDTCLGLLKPYIPHMVCPLVWNYWEDMLYECNPALRWDLEPRNVRMDNNGNLWIVDTDIRNSYS